MSFDGLRLPRWIAVLTATAIALNGTWAGAWASFTGNTYTIEGLSQYTTVATPFTVKVEGPTAICSMSFADQIDTAAPWQFTLSPGASVNEDSFVRVRGCDETVDFIPTDTVIPWTLDSSVMSRENAPGQMVNFYLLSNIAEDAQAQVTGPDGKVLATTTVPAQAGARISFKASSASPVVTYPITVTTSSLRMTLPAVVSNKWQSLNQGRPTFPRCSTITWYYDKAYAAKGASPAAIRSDITGALARLSKITGLRFTETLDKESLPSSNSLIIDWQFTGGSNKTAATGGFSTSSEEGTRGHIHLNSKNWWTNSDTYKGFGIVRGSHTITGRGWMIVHETMHALGLDHTMDRGQLMYPTMSRQTDFGSGDKAGLSYLYRPNSCSNN